LQNATIFEVKVLKNYHFLEIFQKTTTDAKKTQIAHLKVFNVFSNRDGPSAG
jgi:hypothetical protein